VGGTGHYSTFGLCGDSSISVTQLLPSFYFLPQTPKCCPLRSVHPGPTHTL
jgi:hypothetical protein